MRWWQPLIQAGAVPGSGSKGEEPEAAEPAELVVQRDCVTVPSGTPSCFWESGPSL